VFPSVFDVGALNWILHVSLHQRVLFGNDAFALVVFIAVEAIWESKLKAIEVCNVASTTLQCDLDEFMPVYSGLVIESTTTEVEKLSNFCIHRLHIDDVRYLRLKDLFELLDHNVDTNGASHAGDFSPVDQRWRNHYLCLVPVVGDFVEQRIFHIFELWKLMPLLVSTSLCHHTLVLFRMKACALVEPVECEGLGGVAEGRLGVGIGRRHCEIVYERSGRLGNNLRARRVDRGSVRQ
jgi:hypothetical protein